MPQREIKSAGVRILYQVMAWLFFCLGMLGVLLPVLPTTPFLLLSLWAFSRGSRRLHDWLYHHPRFGPGLQRWQRHRIIPLHAKLLITLTMSASLVYLVRFSDISSAITLAIGLLMLSVAGYLLTRPSSLKVANNCSD